MFDTADEILLLESMAPVFDTEGKTIRIEFKNVALEFDTGDSESSASAAPDFDTDHVMRTLSSALDPTGRNPTGSIPSCDDVSISCVSLSLSVAVAPVFDTEDGILMLTSEAGGSDTECVNNECVVPGFGTGEEIMHAGGASVTNTGNETSSQLTVLDNLYQVPPRLTGSDNMNHNKPIFNVQHVQHVLGLPYVWRRGSPIASRGHHNVPQQCWGLALRRCRSSEGQSDRGDQELILSSDRL